MSITLIRELPVHERLKHTARTPDPNRSEIVVDIVLSTQDFLSVLSQEVAGQRQVSQSHTLLSQSAIVSPVILLFLGSPFL